MADTLYEKLWNSHVVSERADGSTLIYVDRHLLHEVSTPQSFVALGEAGRPVRRPMANLAVADHAVPTHDRDKPIADPQARAQVARLIENTAAFGVPYIELTSEAQGIAHVVGPELGFTLPGITIVCGDSHTSTHGAFGALAFGIGASECGVMMATQCLIQRRSKAMRVRVGGELHPLLSAKDLALCLIAKIGANGGGGYAIEYTGAAVERLSMAGRMTLCNMTIEAGGRVGLIAPDETTFAYVEGRRMAPKGRRWEQALDYWRTLPSGADAAYDREVTLDADALAPYVTWGTSPEEAAPITGRAPGPPRTSPIPASATGSRNRCAIWVSNPASRCPIFRSTGSSSAPAPMAGSKICGPPRRSSRASMSRLPSPPWWLRVRPRPSIRPSARGWTACSWTPASNGGSRDARCASRSTMTGWSPGQRCAATSNRNFEGRQGAGGRTHLMSPVMAAAAAVTGHLVDVRELGA